MAPTRQPEGQDKLLTHNKFFYIHLLILKPQPLIKKN